MKDTRYEVVARQLETINGSFDNAKISQALARIALATLPDWGHFVVPAWLIDGLRPLFSRLFELDDSLKTDLLECLAHIYESPAGLKPDLNLDELKANLESLPLSALPFALAIIGREGAPAVRYLRLYADHGQSDVRTEARAALERMEGTVIPLGELARG